MTGYGYHESVTDTSIVAVEVKSYNNRYLEIAVNTPPSLNALESRIRERLSLAISRGRVEVYVKAGDIAKATSVLVDTDSVSAYVEALEKVKAAAGIDDPIRLSDLLRLEGVLRLETSPDVEECWSVLSPVLEAAMEQHEVSRQSEGAVTEVDIRTQLARVGSSAAVFRENAPDLESRIKTQLVDRFAEVLGNEVDEARVYAETAVLLVKYSINEEIVRLESHLNSAEELLGRDEPVGKRLDFTCQEINREINTIGSKSILTDVNQAVVDAKDAVENVREQLRNVE